MFSRNRRALIAAMAAGALVLALPAAAVPDHETRPHTTNMHAKGHSPHPATFLGEPDGVRHINSDIAFWGRLALNGNYDGFRIIDISDADNPQEIFHQRCSGDQGEIFVWDNVLVRSWNSKKTVEGTCDGHTVPAGWEGVHDFDLSDLTNPELVASVELPCGSHTLTGAKDGDRLIVYSNISSSAGCAGGDPAGDFIDVIEVPLGNPAGSNLLRRQPLAGPITAVATGCHDAVLITGDVNLLACASADAINVFNVCANSLPGGPSVSVCDQRTRGRPGRHQRPLELGSVRLGRRGHCRWLGAWWWRCA